MWLSCSLPMGARKDRLRFPVSALSTAARPSTSRAPLIWWAKPNRVFNVKRPVQQPTASHSTLFNLSTQTHTDTIAFVSIEQTITYFVFFVFFCCCHLFFFSPCHKSFWVLGIGNPEMSCKQMYQFNICVVGKTIPSVRRLCPDLSLSEQFFILLLLLLLFHIALFISPYSRQNSCSTYMHVILNTTLLSLLLIPSQTCYFEEKNDKILWHSVSFSGYPR